MRILEVILLAIIYSQSIQLGMLRFEMRILGLMILGLAIILLLQLKNSEVNTVLPFSELREGSLNTPLMAPSHFLSNIYGQNLFLATFLTMI